MESNEIIKDYNKRLKDDVYSDDILTQLKNTIGNADVLTDDEFRELYYKYKQGSKEARDEILRHNYALVLSIAKTYTNWGWGIPVEDAFQQGSIFLMKALDTYDIDKEVKFSTYATYVIENGLKNYIFDISSQMVRIPSNFYNKYIKIKAIERTLLIELGREPTNLEIAVRLIDTRLDLSKSEEETEKLIKKEAKRIDEIKNVFKPVKSLDIASVDDDGDSKEDKYNIISSSEELLDDKLIRKENQRYLKENLYDILRNIGITEKEMSVLIDRTPDEEGKKISLMKIAEKLNVTNEWIRQIEKGTKEKIKKKAPYLRDYID